MKRHSLRDAAVFWRKSPVLLFLLAVELAVFLFSVWAAVQPPVHYAFTPEQLEDIAGEDVTLTYDENGYYGVTYDIGGQDILQTPALSLVPGNYRATVTYAYQPTKTADGVTHHSNIRLEDPDSASSVLSSAMVLNLGAHSQQILLKVYRATDTARVVFHDDGGTYTVGSLTLTQAMGPAVLGAFATLLACLAVNGVLLCLLPKSPFYRGPGAAIAFAAVAGTVVFTSAPLLTGGVDMTTADSLFHLSRIEGIAQGLQDGQFPVRLNSLAKDSYGYANSMFYGELFLYFPALLRLLGVTVQDAYRIYALTTQAATGISAYFSFRAIFGRRAAVFGSILYLLSAYRLHRYYSLTAVGEYTAWVFLPIILYGLWMLYHGTPDRPALRRAMLALALGYTGLLQCHMITTELAILAGAAVALIFWRKTFRPAVLLTWLKAAGLGLLLNLWYLVPFATLMLSGDYSRMASQNIQSAGLSVGEMFSFYHGSTVGMPLLIGSALSACVLLQAGRRCRPWYRMGCVSLAIGAAGVCLSTSVFPWDQIGQIPVIGYVLTSIQFPWRYITIASIALIVTCLSATRILQEHPLHLPRMAIPAAAAFLALLLAGNYTGDIIMQHRNMELADFSQLSYAHDAKIRMPMDTLYLPANAVETQDGFVCAAQVTSATTGDFVREDKGVTSVEYDEYLGQDGHVEFPLLYYPGYKVVEGTGTIFETANGMVGVLVSANSSGRLAVAFREPLRWRLADLVSLAAALGLAGYCAARHFRRRRSAPLPPTARRAGQR